MGFFRRRRNPSPNEPVPDELERRSDAALDAFDAERFALAEQLWQGMLTDYEGQLGENHPVIIVTLDRLGSALFRQRSFHAAAFHHREAHRRAVVLYGRLHSETLTFAHNLGCALVIVQDWHEGLPVLQGTLEGRQRLLGADHPDTLETAKTLGVSLFMTGDYRSALSILQPAHEAALRTLGPTNPRTQDIAQNLDIVVRRSGSF